MQTIIKNKEYEINILNVDLENIKGKIWNVCLINMLSQCHKPLTKINVLNERVLEGGIKLTLWENKE